MTQELIDYHKTKMCLAGAEGRTEDYKFHKAAIELFEKLSLPSNIDDAAEKYSENILANNEDLQDAIEDAFKAGAQWRDIQIPKLPNSLDEAAEEYKEEFGKYLYGISTAFKAGAEWMAGPCVKVEGRVSSQQGKRMMVTTNIFENDDWFVSDKVECFIRKKQ